MAKQETPTQKPEKIDARAKALRENLMKRKKLARKKKEECKDKADKSL